MYSTKCLDVKDGGNIFQTELFLLPWCCLLSSFASFERIEAAAHSLLAQLELLHGLHRLVHLLDALVRLEQGHLLT